MTDFNPINFINKLSANSQGGANRANAGQVEAQNQNSNQSQNAPKTQQGQAAVPLNVPSKMAPKINVAQMDIAQKSNFARELMNLPRELKEFLNQKIVENQGKLTLESFKDAPAALQKLNIAQLVILLGENSKVANQKLLQMIVEISRNQGGDVKQLKEMMAMFSSSVNPASISNEANQTLKNLILLYLPWLPLRESKEDLIDFDLDFFEEENLTDEKKGAISQSVSVLIQTKNYGNIQAFLELQSPNNLSTVIYCGEDFPKKMLEKLLNQEAKEINLNSTLITEKITQKNSPDKISSQNVKINAASSVNSYLLLITYSLIRLVISIDKNNLSSN